jgi:hypothetical protein
MSVLKTQDQGTIVLDQQDYLAILIESFLIDRRSQGLSFGSESGGGRADILRALALRYQKVFVWADNPKKASEIRNVLGSFAAALQSPIQNGVKWDANKMLQEGVLHKFISKLFEAPCLG